MEASADVMGGQYNGFYLRLPPLQGSSTTPATTLAAMLYVGNLQGGKGFALPRPPPRPPSKLPADFQSRVVKSYQKSVPSSLPSWSPPWIEKPPLPPLQPLLSFGKPPRSTMDSETCASPWFSTKGSCPVEITSEHISRFWTLRSTS